MIRPDQIHLKSKRGTITDLRTKKAMAIVAALKAAVQAQTTDKLRKELGRGA